MLWAISVYAFTGCFFWKVSGIPVGIEKAPLVADLSLHTYDYDFMIRKIERDVISAIIEDLFSINDENLV